MELIVVTPPDYFNGEGDLINQFFATGLQLLHIRKPENDPVMFRKLIKEINPKNYSKISIHQHHDLAAEFSLQRLHFTEKYRKEVAAVRIAALAAKGYMLSSSIHGLPETDDLDGFEYVFFGPVFNSISKVGYDSPLKSGFVLPEHRSKIFAIGGITESKLGVLKQMKFDGAAVLGTVWHQSVSPLTAIKSLIKSINEFQ